MGTYFVDSGGANTAGTDWDSSWNTIGSAIAQVSAGDLVWIADGTYQEKLIPTVNGASGTEIHFCAEHIGSVTIDGLGSFRPLYLNGVSYWDWIGIKFYNSNLYGVQIHGAAAQRNRFYYCDAISNSHDGFIIDTDAKDNEFRCCKAQNNGKDGFCIGPFSASSRNNYCWNCLSVENTQEGFTANSKYATFLNCTAGSNLGNGFFLWWAYAGGMGELKHCIAYGNDPQGIMTYLSNSDIDYNCSYGNVGSSWNFNNVRYTLTGWQDNTPYGDNSIEQDPLFTVGSEGSYYLSEIAAGQASDSPCIDIGSQLASDDPTMGTLWTRTDEVADSGTLNLGYHYGIDSSLIPFNPYPAPKRYEHESDLESLSYLSWIRIAENKHGWGSTTLQDEGYYVECDSESLIPDYDVRERDSKIKNTREPKPSSFSVEAARPVGGFTQQPRTNDSLMLFQSFFQVSEFIGTVINGYGTGTFSFVPIEDNPDWEGSTWGTLKGGTDVVTGDLYPVTVEKCFGSKFANRGEKYDCGIVNRIDWNQAYGGDLTIEPYFKFWDVNVLGSFGTSGGTYSDKDRFVDWKGTITFEYDGTGTSLDMLNWDLGMRTETYDHNRIGRKGMYRFPFGASIFDGSFDLELEDDHFERVFLDKGSASLTMRWENSPLDWIQIEQPHIKYRAHERGIDPGAPVNYNLPYRAYPSEDGATSSIKVKVCTSFATSYLSFYS